MTNNSVLDVNLKLEKMDKNKIKEKIGKKRYITQFADTFAFDMSRNLKKTIILFITMIGFFALNFLIQQLQESRGLNLPENAEDYLSSFLSGFFPTIIIVISCAYGGSILAEDFEKRTGHLIFPKISRTRFFFGKYLARFTMASICLAFYYALVSSLVFIKYSELPFETINSYLWAILYMLMVYSFVTLLSSIMKTTSYSVIISMLLLLIVFNMLEQILKVSGSTIEPLFIITYYANIISACFDMPIERYSESLISLPAGGDAITFGTWSTPSELGALIGMTSYIILMIVVALYVYSKRQMKE